MQTAGWFTGGPSFQSKQEPESLLEGWKQYEAVSQGVGADLEQGPRPKVSHSSTLQQKSKGGLGLDINPFFRSASESVSGVFSSVSRNVQDLPGSIHKSAASMPSQRAVGFFVSLLGAGIFFMSLSFTVFLPLIALAPQKFAICFSVGSSLVMGAFFALKGPAAQLQSMLAPDRLPFTAFFVGSMIATLYCSMVMHSYILSVLSSGAQVLSLSYYVISFFPGGAAGLRFLTSTFTATFRGIVGI